MMNLIFSGRQIERVKQAAVGVMYDCGVGRIKGVQVAARRFALIATKVQQAGFVIDQTLGRASEVAPPLQPAGQALSEIADPPRDPPRPSQISLQILNGIKHAKRALLLLNVKPRAIRMPIAARRKRWRRRDRS